MPFKFAEIPVKFQANSDIQYNFTHISKTLPVVDGGAGGEAVGTLLDGGDDVEDDGGLAAVAALHALLEKSAALQRDYDTTSTAANATAATSVVADPRSQAQTRTKVTKVPTLVLQPGMCTNISHSSIRFLPSPALPIHLLLTAPVPMNGCWLCDPAQPFPDFSLGFVPF